MKPYAVCATPNEETNWIDHLSWVARFSTGKSDEVYTHEENLRVVKGCYKRGHLSVFEHWPVTVNFGSCVWTKAFSQRFYQRSLRECESMALLTLPFNLLPWRTNAAVLPVLASIRLRSAAHNRYTPGYTVKYGHPPEPHRHRLETFEVGCSRGCADELRTYRLLTSYVFESQRRVVPAGIIDKGDSQITQLAECYLATAKALSFVKSAEVVKELYPRSVACRFVMTSTLGGWAHIIDQRLRGVTGRPESEIREVAGQIDESLRMRYGETWARDFRRFG